MPDKLESRKSNVFAWIKSNPYLLALILILLISFILRLIVFNLTSSQPIWWDEGDYTYAAKRWGLDLETRDLWYYRRVFFFPLMSSAVFMLGGSEVILRLIIMLLSTLTVYITYLIGKEMYNKEIGLVAASGVAISRLYLFFTGRLLTELPALAFLLLAYYLFYRGYVKSESNKYIYLSAVFFGLTFFTRVAESIAIIPIAAYILLKNNFKAFLDKRLWIFALIILLILTPYLYQYKQHYPSGLEDFFKHYTQQDVPEEQRQLPWLNGVPRYLFNLIPNSSLPFFLIFLVGLVSFYEIFLGLDLLFKPEGEEIRKKIFLFLWLITPIMVHGMITEIDLLEERYIMFSYPALFIITGIGFSKIKNYLSKYNKVLVTAILIVFLSFGAYSQITYGIDTVKAKMDSYGIVKQSGLWLKQHSNPSDVIISQSRPVHAYYTERTIWSPSEFKNASKVSVEENFEKNLSVLNPKYFVVSVFEQHPTWAYDYAQRHNLKIANGWFADPQRTQPVLVIYEFPSKN